ncbi:hypothetical protein [Comamonas sp. JC664]|uniref:hypothetical protein n=1 Tax=Comamonas sp. JC664 TaxID=2801917 RepID=UPI00174E9CF0|nr:hypothetical protein [Comamonas sp. JC664]MBL0695959.1 hypothetical protein [Comamonas sp. JC664]GHG64464.1 hypothetical protein GCM10012319_04890 [Comamonas sp. KCTC 72670]
MKNMYFAVALGLALTGCVDNVPNIQVANAFVPTAQCTVNSTGPASPGGALDLSISSRYLVGIAVRNTLTSREVVVNDGPLTGTGDQSAINITDVELNYEVVGTGPSLTSDVYQSHIVLPGNATTNSSIIVDLLGGNGREGLLSYLGTGDSLTVLVRMRLLGKLVGGGKTESNEITYPIQFYRSGFTCPAGTFLEPTGPCGGPPGQDNYAPTCTDPDDA